MKETLEEASKRAIKSGLFKDETLFIAGGKWQQERSYSEEEVLDILKELEIECVINPRRTEIREWFNKFKKK
jgi:hypothetical protein